MSHLAPFGPVHFGFFLRGNYQEEATDLLLLESPRPVCAEWFWLNASMRVRACVCVFT